MSKPGRILAFFLQILLYLIYKVDEIFRALLWILTYQSSSLGNLLRDRASRAGGGLRSLQTDGMVSEYRNDVYHSSHLLRESNVLVNQCMIHLRRAKPITYNRSLSFIFYI